MQADELLWAPAEHTVLAGASTNGACQGSLTFWQGCSNNNASSELSANNNNNNNVAVLGIWHGAVLSICLFGGWGRPRLSYTHLLLFLSQLKRTSSFSLLKHQHALSHLSLNNHPMKSVQSVSPWWWSKMKMLKVSVLSEAIQLTSGGIRIQHQAAHLLFIMKLNCLMEELSMSHADCHIRSCSSIQPSSLAPFYGDVH